MEQMDNEQKIRNIIMKSFELEGKMTKRYRSFTESYINILERILILHAKRDAGEETDFELISIKDDIRNMLENAITETKEKNDFVADNIEQMVDLPEGDMKTFTSIINKCTYDTKYLQFCLNVEQKLLHNLYKTL